MPGRNARQCHDRWLSYLSPEIGNGPWSPEEEQLLIRKYEEFGAAWKHIATFFVSRTDINVKSRWLLIQRRMRRIATRNVLSNPARSIVLPFYQMPVATTPNVQPLPVMADPAPQSPNPIPEDLFANSPPPTDVWGSLMLNQEAPEFSFESWF
jgi:hypothetical protein